MGQCLSLLQKLPDIFASVIPQGEADIPSAPPSTTTTPAAIADGPITHAYVSRMPDGDTLTCTYTAPDGQKASVRVRVFAIDCPETAQNFGLDAKQIGQALLLHKTVTLHPHTIDRYGRLVADVVTHTGINYSEYMLRKGAAWHYKAYDNSPVLAQLEIDARASRVGLWAFPRPQPPWDYRRRHRTRPRRQGDN